MNSTQTASDFFVSFPQVAPDAYVGQLIDHAVDLNASDLFFNTHEHHVVVQARHLGIYRMLAALDLEFGRHCLSHIKSVADLDITEHRHPQDGRWLREGNGRTTDIRVNTLPTLYGEDCALRLLVRDRHLLALESLGLRARELEEVRRMLTSPGGLILVTGPTGAGKTTTLYAALNYLNNGERKINTIEDPIEYALPGIRQSQVNLHVGIDFPEILRSVLRQAPDVIMIGEIRDAVTAETAVRAANSGHLVLATTHAPIAAGAVQSMLSLGVHPHFLGASLRAVLAQRLVRTLCPNCKTRLRFSPSERLFSDVKASLGNGQEIQLYAAAGCDDCHRTGYAGRSGVFEVLPVNAAIRHLIFEGQPATAIHDKAVAEGMLSFQQAAWLNVAEGETSTEEVIRAIPAEILSGGQHG